MSLTDENQGRAAIVSRALARALGDQGGLLARLPVGVYSCDADGVLVQYNETAAALWGWSPPLGDPAIRFTGAKQKLGPRGEEVPPDQTPLARVVASGEPVRNVEMHVVRPDGTRVVLLANADPLFDEQGRLVGGVNCVQDITALKDHEQRLRRGARAVRELIDALPAAIYTTDAAGKITFFNKSAVELWGREPVLNEDEYCGSHKIYNADGVELALGQCPMAMALKTGQPVRDVEAIVERPDGSRTACMPYPTPFHDPSTGALLGAINMLVDITPRKQAETRQKIMIDELNHRVKNTLATVQAIAQQSFRAPGAQRGEVDGFLARLMALSKTHDHLTREQWEYAELNGLIEDVLAPLKDRARERVQIACPKLRLSPRAALTLGLTLNELATNAMKYGSMSVDGRLDVRSEITNGGLFITWRESGGPSVVSAPKRGFGTQMIERGLASELDGRAEIRFAPTGLECDLHMPLSSLA